MAWKRPRGGAQEEELLLMENESRSSIGGGGEEVAVSLRRRRMEIRRIKMLSNHVGASSSSFAADDQPVSKRLRHPAEGDPHAECSDEWGQSSGSEIADDDDVIDDNDDDVEEDERASASSLSSAWMEERGKYCADGDSLGNNNLISDRMSSGGSAQNNNFDESDVSSTVTSVGGGGGGGGFQGSFDTSLGDNNNNNNNQGGVCGGRRGSTTTGEVSTPPAAATTTADMSSTDTVTIEQHLDATMVPTFAQQQPLRRQQSSHAVPEAAAAAAAATAGEGSQQHRGNCFAGNQCPSHGMVSLCGRRREMEDAVVSQDSFVSLPCSEAGGCDAEGLDVAPLHYFGVYDGHGGSQAANFCAQRLHKTLAEEVETHFVQGQNNNSSSGGEQVEQMSGKSLDWESKWLAAMTQCFKRMDAEVGGFSLEDEGECTANDNPRCCPEPIAPETVGTTAIVAVVGACQIIVGNCGDSRAVLSRGGVAVPLSVDHKPEREDEMARVEAAGGRVIYWNGHRVLGVLAMSRAIGDRYLKPYVIADPEVKCIKRTEDDECLILASDGLWDVMSNEVVCDVARRALNCKRNNSGNSNSNNNASSSSGGTEQGASTNEEESPAAQAAALLVKLALAKGSSDNISVVVVDLMKAHR